MTLGKLFVAMAILIFVFEVLLSTHRSLAQPSGEIIRRNP